MSDWGRRESAGERIEIELTPVEPRHEKSRIGVPPAADRSPEDGTQLPALPGTHDGQAGAHVPLRTLIATAGAVGVAALALGWVVGRGGGDDDTAATDAPTATTVAVTTTELITDTIAPPVTTARPRPSTTTTSTLPAGRPVDVLLAPELRALPYELAVSTYGGALHRIDFAAGTVRTYPRNQNGENYVAFSPSGDLLEFTPWDASVLRTITLDGSPTYLSTDVAASRAQQVVVDGAGTVWLLTNDNLATAIASADDASQVVQLPAGSFDRGGILGDPGGGLLAYTSGDLFDLDPSGATRITTGEIMALGADTAVVSECNEAFVCGHVVIDRRTGERQPFPLQEIVDQFSPPLAQLTADSQITIQYVGYWPTQATVAAATAVFGITTSNGSSSFGGGLAIIDLAERRLVGVLADNFGPIAISADGLWVFSAGSGTGLVAFEVATGDVYQFGPDIADGFNSIVVRTI